MKELAVDGKQIRTGSNFYSAHGSSRGAVMLNIPYATEIALVNEMNVMHSGASFPERIELKIAYAIGDGE